MKNMYEIFDEVEAAKTEEEKIRVLQQNSSRFLFDILTFTFDERYQWIVNEIPHNYIPSQETVVGISRCRLNTELRRMYLFSKGNRTAESLTERKRNELLITLLESLEPREAEVVLGILKKDQGVDGLTYDLVNKAFPSLLPDINQLGEYSVEECSKVP